jgi:hypothetical protein
MLPGAFGKQLRELAPTLRPARLFPRLFQMRVGGGHAQPQQFDFARQFRKMPPG